MNRSLSASLSVALILGACLTLNAQSKTFDIGQVRGAFRTAAAEHFEILGDELAGLESEKRPGAYWLTRIKPKKPGHYAVKYVYKYNDKFYSEGENVIRFGVGGSPCDRRPHSEGGIARFCSNDTVILPVRAANRYDYTFDIKFTYEDPAASELKKATPTTDPAIPKIQNPLSSNLKFIGTRVSSMPNRSCCITRYEYYAVFEAGSPGKFNIGLSLADKTAGAPAADVTEAFFRGGMPVVILDPGKPITYLAGYEDTINYADDRKFSSHSGGTFPTRLLILQPGDRVELRFLSTRTDEKAREDKPGFLARDILPSVEKYPFYLNPDWSYNAFIADYFPAGK
jgi:hypothetical protein